MLKKNILKSLLLACLIMPMLAIAGGYKPFILASNAGSSVESAVAKVKSKLRANGIQILGQYSPYIDKTAVIIGTTTPQLKAIANKVNKGGFGAVIRVAVTKNESNIEVSFVNPEYMGYAYHMGSLAAITNQYVRALGKQKSFGSRPRSKSKLNEFHYMMFMPYFKDHKVAAKLGSQKMALNKITKAIKSRKTDVTEAWRLKLSDTKTIIAVSLSGGRWDGKMKDIMSILDTKTPRGTAALPWEFLVENGKMIYLPGKFRIAVMFPDLTMSTFMKIGNIPNDMDETAMKVAKVAKKM